MAFPAGVAEGAGVVGVGVVVGVAVVGVVVGVAVVGVVVGVAVVGVVVGVGEGVGVELRLQALNSKTNPIEMIASNGLTF